MFHSYFISLTLLLILFSLFYLRKNDGFFNLAVFFNACAFMYFVVGIWIYYADILDYYASPELIEITKLAFFAVLGFNAGYLFLSKKSKENNLVTKHFYVPTYFSVFTVFLIGIAAHLFLILKTGPYNFFFVDRVERFSIYKNYQEIVFIYKAINIALMFSLYRAFFIGKKRDIKLAVIILSYNLFFAIMTISRSELILNFICLFYFLETKNIISKKRIFIIGLLMALLMFSYKGFLYLYILGDKNYGIYNPGEFINWIRNSIIMIKGGYTYLDLENNSYLLALKGVFLLNPGGDALSEWFIKEFYSDRVSAGLTYGFSGLVEGYLYLGVFGVFIHFFVFGLFFSYLEKNKNPIRIVLTISAMILMFRVFRSEMYNFLRTFSWYYLYPIVFFVLIDKLLKQFNSSRHQPSFPHVKSE